MKTNKCEFETPSQQLNISAVSRSWWGMLSEDDQIWIMMRYGFETFKPKNLTSEQIEKLYTLENS